jgi:hypothetical protein
MENFIETIEGESYSSIHPRALEHEGCIIDIGCYDWNWSNFLIGKKRVIGVDPFESRIPEGAELFKGLIGTSNGITGLNFNNHASTITNNNENILDSSLFPVLSWKTFCKKYDIDKISILKMNIEGSEYPLLHSMDLEDFEKIDQIIVSFHNWLNPNWEYLTKHSFGLLGDMGFELYCINWQYRWYLGLKK